MVNVDLTVMVFSVMNVVGDHIGNCKNVVNWQNRLQAGQSA